MEKLNKLIITWFEKNKRDLPWRKEKNAYHILLSEIIMQQTRIDQGTPYFLKISAEYPSIKSLSEGSEETLLRHWQGLGYYSRARNLHATARQILEHYDGKIPASFSELKKLKGIGDYTAAAIASIAFDEPVPVIDGNVMRVVARLFAIELPINTNNGKKAIQQALSEIFCFENPGVFNEALMEFGALQCVPSNPDCNKCPLKKYCKAFELKRVSDFPIKNPSKEIKNRFFNYLVFFVGNKPLIIMKKREENDIWKNLYEFPLIESEKAIPDEILSDCSFWSQFLFTKDNTMKFDKIVRYQHKLTHRILNVAFVVIKIENEKNIVLPEGFLLATFDEVHHKPKPILIQKFIDLYV